MNIFSREITVYDNMYDTAGHRATVGSFLNDTSRAADIERLRASTDPDLRRTIKRSLPQATLSGIFEPSRRASNLVQHSGLLCIDIDQADNNAVPGFDTLKEDLMCHLAEVAYAARSVGGKGYFAIIAIRHPQFHRQHFMQLQRDFAALGLTVDSACSDVCRLRCATLDPQPFVNPDPVEYAHLYRPPRPLTVPCRHDAGATLERVSQCCRDIVARHVDITAGYHNWFEVGAALASLGEDGRQFFHAVSGQNPQYNPAETDRKFTSLLRSGRRGIGIGTFFKHCSDAGV